MLPQKKCEMLVQTVGLRYVTFWTNHTWLGFTIQDGNLTKNKQTADSEEFNPWNLEYKTINMI